MTASCGGCDRRWTGHSECHCATCHRHFGGVFGFDAHRVGGECVDPADLCRKDGNPVLMMHIGPHGVTWRRWVATPHPRSVRR